MFHQRAAAQDAERYLSQKLSEDAAPFMEHIAAGGTQAANITPAWVRFDSRECAPVHGLTCPEHLRLQYDAFADERAELDQLRLELQLNGHRFRRMQLSLSHLRDHGTLAENFFTGKPLSVSTNLHTNAGAILATDQQFAFTGKKLRGICLVYCCQQQDWSAAVLPAVKSCVMCCPTGLQREHCGILRVRSMLNLVFLSWWQKCLCKWHTITATSQEAPQVSILLQFAFAVMSLTWNRIRMYRAHLVL